MLKLDITLYSPANDTLISPAPASVQLSASSRLCRKAELFLQICSGKL